MLSARTCFGGAVIAALVVSLAVPANAALRAEYNANAGGPGSEGVVERLGGWIGFSGGDSSKIRNLDPPRLTDLSAAFIVYAAHGSLGAAANAVVTGDTTYSGASSFARVYFHDMVTIDAPGLTGTTGTFGARMRLDGQLSPSHPYETVVNVSAELAAWSTVGGDYVSRSYSDPLGAVHELLEISVPFIYGDPFELEATLTTSATASLPNFRGGRSAVSDFANSFNWTGPAFVRDASGTDVTSYTISAASGADYTGPIVPEPATATLLSLAALGLTTRRTTRP